MTLSRSPLNSTAEQRRADRDELEAPIRMRLETDYIAGQSDNISRVGLMFFTDEPLRVSVEVTEKGERKTYRGRLVRVQRMNETNTGLAIEFDEA